VGYGFNDEHLNNAITMALRTNTSMHLLAVSPSMFEGKDENGNPDVSNADVNKHTSFKILHKLITENESKRVGLLAANFSEFVTLIPMHIHQDPDVLLQRGERATLTIGTKND
jgi:biotin synthase-related radical SAM superfamily protein